MDGSAEASSVKGFSVTTRHSNLKLLSFGLPWLGPQRVDPLRLGHPRLCPSKFGATTVGLIEMYTPTD